MGVVVDQLCDIQGQTQWEGMDIGDLCLIFKFEVPKNSKMPEMEKFNDTTNLWLHMKSYVNKMVTWSKEEKFLVHVFQESLAGPTLTWFIQLD